jgi:hypothetical protein
VQVPHPRCTPVTVMASVWCEVFGGGLVADMYTVCQTELAVCKGWAAHSRFGLLMATMEAPSGFAVMVPAALQLAARTRCPPKVLICGLFVRSMAAACARNVADQ